MLAKLIALDFRFYRKMLWKPLAICLFIFLFSSMAVANRTASELGMFVSTLTLLVMLGFVVWAIVAHYYRHFYTHQGYLTHTLPATTAKKLWSKFFSGMILYLLALATFFLGMYFLLRISLGPAYKYFGLPGMLDFLVKYLKTPGILLAVGLLFLSYVAFFTTYALTIGLGMNKYLQRFGGGGIAIAFVGLYLFKQLIGFIGSQVPLSLRVFLNSRWYKMIELVPVKPISTFESLLNWDPVPAATHIDIGVIPLAVDFLLIIASILLIHRSLKKINLR